VRTYAVDPADLGIEHVDASALLGGDAARNLELATSVLAGDRGAHRDIVLLNAAAGLVAAGVVDELADGYEAAAASIDGGAATAVLERAVTVSQRAKAAEPASS
jgi:anthranilate phosphoribosyltransferase